jgi:invasion protein IalB
LPSSAPVESQPAPARAEIVTRFADWELTCVEPAEANKDSESGANASAKSDNERANEKAPASDVARSACRVSQRLAVKGTSETVFMVSVLPAKQPGLEAAIISTPLGGYLAPGMELKIDKGRPARLLYETCNQAGCHGGFALTGRMREALFKGKRLQVRLWTAKEKPVDVEVSLDGLAPAVKALEEAGK